MSILNFNVEPHRALVCVDTLGAMSEDGRFTADRYELSKMIPLVHANTVIASRGDMNLMFNAFLMTWVSKAQSFDAITDQMPESIARARAMMIDHVRTQTSIDPMVDEPMFGITNELVCIGWSDRQQAMTAMYFKREATEQQFDVQQMEWLVSPGFEGLKRPTTPHTMANTARRQMRWIADNWRSIEHGGRPIGGAPIAGGRLLCAEITRSSMTIRELCEIEESAPVGGE